MDENAEERRRAEFKEKIRSLSFRARIPPAKVTVDHTDQTVNTVTEHWADRQDVHVQVREPVTARKDPNSDG